MGQQAQATGEIAGVGQGAAEGEADADSGAHEHALASMDAAIATHACADDRASQVELARALMSKAIVLSRLGRGAEELVSYDEVIRRYSMSGDAELVAFVAMAHNRRGRALVMADKLEDALTAFDLAWAVATGWKEPALQRQAAAALYATGTLRKQQGRTADALSAWGDMVRQFADSDDVEVAMKTVTADQARASMLRGVERLNDAIRVYNDLIARVAKRGEAQFRAALGGAAQTRAECLMETENFKGVVEGCEDAAGLLEQDKDDARIDPWRAALEVLRGRALRKMGRVPDAVAAFSGVDKAFRDSTDAKVGEMVATALVELAELMADESEFAKARAFCDMVVRRYGAREDDVFEGLVQRARLQAAKALAGMNDAGAALGALKEWVGETAAKADGDLETLRANPAFDQYLQQAKTA